jgi:outer membrane protein OmpA-like peptidoglycan-associated protein
MKYFYSTLLTINVCKNLFSSQIIKSIFIHKFCFMIISSIKQLALTGILVLGSLLMFAQAPFTGSSQFRKFSVGLNAGALRPSVILGGSNDFTKPLYTFGYGANVKYQLTHYFALQADFLKGKLKGNNDNNLGNGDPATNRVNSSFKTDMKFAASISGEFMFGNVNWLGPKNIIVPYVSAGGGITYYDPVFVRTGSTTGVSLKNGSNVKEFFVPVGVGLKFRLSDLINLDLGYRAEFVDNDNFDGTRGVYGPNHKDKFSYGFLGIEFAFGKKSKKQLMFDNPAARLNNSIQAQINHLQTQIDTINTKLSRVDSDNDGVPDQFDKEPNTPAGCPVDFRGVSLDTDGDGVPDCKDKEKITPTQCQPVDADGVGKCPDPECCKIRDSIANSCNLGDLPSISFKGKSRGLSSDAKAMLATVASKLKASANCSITISGYPAATKASQALCNTRTAAVKSYLSETEGISADRILTTCEPGGGDANVLDIKSNPPQQ